MRETQGNRYGWISISNHWITATIFLFMIGLGFFLEFGGLEREAKGPYMGLHKSVGTLFLAWAVWRVLWRIAKGFPKDIAIMPTWQKIGAKATHWLLLASIIAMPLSGVIMSLFGGRAIKIFEWFTIPAQNKNEIISSSAHFFHSYAPYFITTLIMLHLIAAIKHHIIDKDETLKRMLGTRI